MTEQNHSDSFFMSTNGAAKFRNDKNANASPAKKENLHSGHRDRMRKRFVEHGIYSMQDHEVLEFLLYSVIPQKDTNAIAIRLIKNLGGLECVFRSDINAIMQAGGISERAAIYIKFIGELKSRLFVDDDETKIKMDSTHAVANYFCHVFNCLGFERFILLSLNADRTLTSCDIICDGNDNSVYVDVRKVVEFAIKNNAAAVILGHNHPGDTTNPSTNDIAITKRIQTVMKALGIELLDHIICSGNNYTSLYERGFMQY